MLQRYLHGNIRFLIMAPLGNIARYGLLKNRASNATSNHFALANSK